VLPGIASHPQVLLAMRDSTMVPSWVNEVHGRLRLAGLSVYRAYPGLDCIERLQRGGVAAAVLWAEADPGDGLGMLRMIRSVDLNLPCWLVLEDATPGTLRAAFALRARSVMTQPVDVGALSFSLTRTLAVTRRSEH